MTQSSRLEIGSFSRLEKADSWETKSATRDEFFRNFFQCLCLNGTAAKPNSKSATAKRSLTILSQLPIRGLVKPNSESGELDGSLSAKYKQPVNVFLHCIPDSCLLCYPTPICKICPALKETSRCEILEKTNRKDPPAVIPEEDFN